MGRSFSQLQAICFAVAGYTIWVLTDVCVKLATDAAISLPEITFVFGIAGMVGLLLRLFRQGNVSNLKPRHLGKQTIYSLLCVLSFLTCALALKHLPFTIFYIAVFTLPMTVAILGATVLRERLTMGKVIAIIAGFVGVVIAIDPFHAGAANMEGDWIGYTSAAVNVLCFSTIMIMLRSTMKSETMDSLAFSQALAQTIGCGVWTYFSYKPLSPFLLAVLCCGGIFSILGNMCNITALKNTTAATVGQFHYTQIISGSLLGYLIWHEIPTFNLVIGSIIIIASGIYIANHMRKAARITTIKPP